jgi:predicted glycoside hydrolase/deacetylase ChbG (UPF0249 family)
VVALRQWQRQFERLAHRYGIRTTTGSVGIVATGALDRAVLREMLESLEDGTWELVCHPGYNDVDLSRIRTKLRQSREVEREALTDRSVFDRLKAQGIELISFREFAAPVEIRE